VLTGYNGLSISGVQQMVDFIAGYEAYTQSLGFEFLNPDGDNRDADTLLSNNWQTEVEKFVDWMFTVSALRNEDHLRHIVRANPLENTFIFDHPSYIEQGTPVLLLAGDGGKLPVRFNNILSQNTPYYLIPTSTYGVVQLAASRLDANKGIAIEFNDAGSGELFLQIYKKVDSLPKFELNPFKSNLWVNHEVGVMSNVTDANTSHFPSRQVIYDNAGNVMNVADLHVFRADRQSRISLVGALDDMTNSKYSYTRLDQSNAKKKKAKQKYISGADLRFEGYEHVIIFNDRAVDGSLIYDNFLGIRTPRFYTEFTRQQGFTLRPNMGGFILQNGELSPNFEAAVSDMRYYYDAHNALEYKGTTALVRNMLGYDGTIDYMDAVRINPKSQFMFWRGMIQNKGTNLAINAFANQPLFSNVENDEFWAYKLGEFGDSKTKIYPEVKLFVSDVSKKELRLEFTGPEGGQLDDSFAEVKLTDASRWWNQPDVIRANAPYNAFFFDTKVTGVIYNVKNKVTTLPSGSVALVLDKPADGALITYREADGSDVKIMASDLDYTFLNSHIITFNISLAGLFDVTVATVAADTQANSPVFVVDKGSDAVVAKVPVWHPAQGQHHQLSYHIVNVESKSDPAIYGVYPNGDTAEAGVWLNEKAGAVWMDTAHADYLPYYDKAIFRKVDDRSFNWGKLAEWGKIGLYQWTESTVHPSEWNAQVYQDSIDPTLPEEQRRSGSVRTQLFVNTEFQTGNPDNWVELTDSHYDFLAATVNAQTGAGLAGEFEIYVNGRYAMNANLSAYKLLDFVNGVVPTQTVRPKEADYIHLIQRAPVPTQEEVEQGLYKYDTPYSVVERFDKIRNETYNLYYFWVADKNEEIPVTGDSFTTLSEAERNLVNNPNPYMILSGLRPGDAGYGVVYGTVFDEDDYKLPLRYTQIIVRGLRGKVKDEERYALRLAKDLTLRDELPSGDGLESFVHNKNRHVEWKLIREKQIYKIDRFLWDRLVEAAIGNRVTDGKPDYTVELPSLNRIVYDNAYDSDSRFGLGEEQVFCDRETAINTILGVLSDPAQVFTRVEISEFLAKYDFNYKSDIVAALAEIYNVFTVEEINKIFFAVLHDAMTLKRQSPDIFKTSWVALQVAQGIQSGTTGTLAPLRLVEGDACGEDVLFVEETPAPLPSSTPTPTPTPTVTPTITVTPSVTPTITVTPTPTATPGNTQTPTPSVTPTRAPTRTPTPTPTMTTSVTPSVTPEVTPTPTPTSSTVVPSAPMGNVISALKFNDTNGSQTFTDETGKTWTIHGDVTISSEESKFGGTSLKSTGGGYIECVNPDFIMGSNPYTFEFWVKLMARPDNGYARGIAQYGTGTDTGDGVGVEFINFNGGSDQFISRTGYSDLAGSGVDYASATMPLEWHHIAICSDGTGKAVLYFDGVSAGPDEYTTHNVPLSIQTMRLGSAALTWGDTNPVIYIDDFLFTTGVRYTGNFTPPGSELTLPTPTPTPTPSVTPTISVTPTPTPTPSASMEILTGDPYWNNVVSLLNFENGFQDEKGYSWSTNGSVTASTANSKFGTHSGRFTSVPSYCYPNSSGYGNFGLNTRDFTIEAWYYCDVIDGSHPYALISRREGGASGWAFVIYPDGSVGVRAKIDSTWSDFRAQSAPSVVSGGQWHHLAFVREGVMLKSFVNGVLVGSENIGSGSFDDSAVATRMHTADQGGEYSSDAYIDNFRITMDVARYSANFTPPSNFANFAAPVTPTPTATATPTPTPSVTPSASSAGSLISSLSFEGTEGSTTITDTSGRTWTAVGNAHITTASPLVGAGSLSLDGSASYITTPGTSDMMFGTGDFTVECAVRTSRAAESYFVDFYGTGTNTWQLGMKANGKVTVYANGYLFESLTSVNDGQKHHIAWVREGGEGRLFIDGVREVTITDTKDYNYVTPVLAIGAQVSVRNASYDTNGLIDSVNIEKVAKYNTNFASGNIVSLLNFEGANNSYTITDETGKAWTSSDGSSAYITTSAAKFGSSSLRIDNTSYISTPDHNDFHFTGDFTIQFFLRPDRLSGVEALAGQWTGSGDRSWIIYKIDSGLQFSYSTDGVSSVNAFSVSTGAFTNTDWSHVAICRSGNTIRGFIDGQQVGTDATFAGSFYNSTHAVEIGMVAADSYGQYHGRMDYFRVDNGVALYKANFTPPTAPETYVAPIPYAANTVSLLHFDGAAGSTTIKDEYGSNWVIAAGSPTIEANPYFGTGALLLSNTSLITSASASASYAPTGDYTIEFWLRPTAIGSMMGLWTLYSASNGPYAYIDGSGHVILYTGSNSVTTPGSLSANTWVHLAFVKIGNTTTLYVNGVSKGSATGTPTAYSPYIKFGADSSVVGSSAGFVGYLDEFRYVNGVGIYTENFVPPAAPFSP
jgi:hypothetical protein